ncbi:MAG: aminotransferase class I/II-fold pyridoxal phosphate-dependent enzyme [Pseudomonadota bacterium]
MKLDTRAIHAGQPVDAETGAVVPGIQPSTTFARTDNESGFFYTRCGNPNRTQLETCLASLEGGKAAAAFASGMAAIMTALQALDPGDHVIAPDDLYFGVRNLHRELFTRWGLAITTVDMSDLDAVRAAVQPRTRMLWIETPSNPLVKVADVEALATIAREAGALACCDNTWATPVLQQPLALGCDLVMHSCTKYLGGHSDVLGGALISAEDSEYFARVRAIQEEGGAVPSPFDCWLVLRGVQTLPVRLRAQCATAARLAATLDAHPAVEVVHYPGLASHAGHAIAARQMAQFGAMLSFCVRGGEAEAMQVADGLSLIPHATSLGGTHTLIEHRASVEGEGSMAPANLLRLSVGLEHVDDLSDDLVGVLDRLLSG